MRRVDAAGVPADVVHRASLRDRTVLVFVDEAMDHEVPMPGVAVLVLRADPVPALIRFALARLPPRAHYRAKQRYPLPVGG